MAMTVISAARDRVGGDAAQTAAQESALELLSGIAVALGHDVDAEFLLAELASGVRRTLDADRVSVLLLDDEGRLTPALAVARQHNDDLWQRFRSMPPIALDALPEHGRRSVAVRSCSSTTRARRRSSRGHGSARSTCPHWPSRRCSSRELPPVCSP